MNNAPSKYTNRYLNINNPKELKGGSFYIESPGKVEENPPVVKSFNADNTNYIISDTIKFSLDAEDNESGLADIYMEYNILPEDEWDTFFYYTQGYIVFEYDELTKKYEGNLKITEEVYKGQAFRTPRTAEEIVDKEIGYFYPWGNIKDFRGNSSSLPISIVNIFSTDINLDDKTDILDIAEISKSYNHNENESNWNAKKDFNQDKIIDIFDIVTVAKSL